MFAASWTPEQWGAIITLIGVTLTNLIKSTRRDKETKEVAAVLATKVDSNAHKVASAHSTVDAKLAEVLDVLSHSNARLEASVAIRQVLSERVDGHEVRINDHENRLRYVEGKAS